MRVPSMEGWNTNGFVSCTDGFLRMEKKPLGDFSFGPSRMAWKRDIPGVGICRWRIDYVGCFSEWSTRLLEMVVSTYQ